MRTITKPCRTCGVDFTTASNNRHHCSVECRLKEIAKPFEDIAGCWEWDRYRNPQSGYGQLTEWVDGKHKLHTAHVVSYRAYKGQTQGLSVLHTCDNRCCFNPVHLFLGTQQDNMDDMWAKGRQGSRTTPRAAWQHVKPERVPRGATHHLSRDPSCMPRGSAHHAAKVTDDDVRAIRTSTETLKKLKARFNLSESTLSKIRRREAWVHVVD